MKVQSPPKLQLVESDSEALRPAQQTVLPPQARRHSSYGTQARQEVPARPALLEQDSFLSILPPLPGIERVQPFELIDSIVEMLFVPEGMKLVLEADSAAFLAAAMPLESVLFQLIDNALAHHDRSHGEVRIAIEDGGDHHLFTISDDGPGIGQELWEDLAALDQDPRNAVETEVIGGLALCARLIERHHAKLSLDIRPGARGTTVRLWWPHFRFPMN